MPRGGKRAGAGRKKGVATLDKEMARALLRTLVTAKMTPMVEAQIANAQGIKYLVVRERKTGKFVRLAKGDLEAELAAGEELVEVWEKDPSIQAFSDLMNRLLDKPAESLKVDPSSALSLVIKWQTSE
jgi:hypothetical protein